MKGLTPLSFTVKANSLASDEDKLTDEEVLSQITYECFSTISLVCAYLPLWPSRSLTFAATDTTSSALSRTMYLLALHKDVQSKLREEIRNTRKECGGHGFNYDSITSLPYLDAIFKETLRL